MKKSEWQRRFGMDLEGVRMLGAAILCWVENQLAAAKENLAGRQNAEHYEVEVRSWEKRHRDIVFRLQALETPKQVIKRAVTLGPMDFRFRWDQLRDHPLLIGYLSDDQPDFAMNWDRKTPISERRSDVVPETFESIFLEEASRLVGPSPDDVPEPRGPEDFQFYLTVWKHCEQEAGRGSPTGRRWADGLQNAASYACSLRSEAEEKGSPISTDEAIRRALEKFEVISSDRFETYPDKGSVVVSDALGDEGRMGGAIKAIRKQIAVWDAEEKARSERGR